MAKDRIYVYDNLKGLLIILVIFAHFLEFILGNNLVKSVYIAIYLFHIPAFVYCTGLFSKFNLKKDIKRLIIPYAVFQLAYWCFAKYVLKSEPYNIISRPYWLMWYLPCTFVWKLAAFLIDKTEKDGLRIHAASVILSVICALGAGYFKSIGYKFSLARLIGFFPFFMIGVFQSRCMKISDILSVVKSKKLMTAAAVVCAAAVIYVFVNVKGINVKITYFTFPYSALDYGIVTRLCIMVSAVGFTVLLLALLPDRSTPLTVIGQRTLYIYLMHGFAVKLLGMLAKKITPLPLAFVYLSACTVFVVILFSSDIAKKLFDNVFCLTDKK